MSRPSIAPLENPSSRVGLELKRTNVSVRHISGVIDVVFDVGTHCTPEQTQDESGHATVTSHKMTLHLTWITILALVVDEKMTETATMDLCQVRHMLNRLRAQTYRRMYRDAAKRDQV